MSPRPSPASLKQLRITRKLSQEALAKKLGVSQARVSKIENTPLEKLEIKTIQAYVEALGGTLGVEIRFTDGITNHHITLR